MRPHNLPLVLLGAGLLWFGWFGFNAGSELAADQTAALAFMNTQVATAAAAGGWLLMERFRDGKPTTLGVASGAVAGLVAITPACAVHRSLGGDPARRRGGRHLLLRDRAEAPARLRRRARRGGRAPGRRRVRRGVALPRRLPAASGQRKGLFYGGGIEQLGVQALGPVASSASTPSPWPGLSARSSTRRWASGSPRRTRSPASTSRSTPRRATTSAASILARPLCARAGQEAAARDVESVTGAR